MEIKELINALRDDSICDVSDMLDYMSEAADLLEEQQERILELEEERRWIPVTERLPDGECIALGYQNEMLIGYIGDSEYSDTGYAAESDGQHLSDVTHWMSLPDVPKEGE